MDKMATSYFQTQKKQSSKQSKWQNFLIEFNYVLEYKSSRANLIADALSQMVEFATISWPQSNPMDRIKEGLWYNLKA